MTTQETFVIVGAGLAGAKAAVALRTEGFDGRVVLVGDESQRPYDRPPLSKDYLQGTSEKDKIYIHPAGWYDEHDIELRLGTRVVAVDPAAHQLTIQDNVEIGYDKLLLTTGSSPRRLSVSGADLDGVLYLRRVEDSEAIKAAFTTAKQAVVIGAGWIGLETAAAARAAGVEVTVLETAKLPLLRVLGPELGEIYAALHGGHGVELRTDVEVAEIVGVDGRVSGVRLTDGSEIDADVVVVGIGITPNTELAEAAGLSVDNGILVDEYLQTSDADIFAAGDVANTYYPSLNRHLRLEHWSAALNQGPVAAANMVGRATAYDQLPYFFSDQYDMGMEYRGHVEAGRYDRVVFRGEVSTGEYIAFWLQHGQVLAAMNVNVWDQSDAITALIRSSDSVDLERLADPGVALEDVAAVGQSAGTARTR